MASVASKKQAAGDHKAGNGLSQKRCQKDAKTPAVVFVAKLLLFYSYCQRSSLDTLMIQRSTAAAAAAAGGRSLWREGLKSLFQILVVGSS